MNREFIPNPYTVLGFFPGDYPTMADVTERFNLLSRIHDLQAGGDPEIVRVIQTAFLQIADAGNPGMSNAFHAAAQLALPEPGPAPEKPPILIGAWDKSANRNWVYRFPDGTCGTVFRRRADGRWQWVFRGKFSPDAFDTPRAATADFERVWLEATPPPVLGVDLDEGTGT